MGIFDLPEPLLSAADDRLSAFLPPAATLILWGALGGLLCMEIYRLTSPQARIAETKLAFAEAQRHVAEFDGEFEDAWPHIRRMLALALRRLAITFPATIIASLPLLLLVVWLDNRYGDTFPPPDETVAVEVSGAFEGRWINPGGGVPRTEVVDRAGSVVATVPIPKPASVIHKWRWWNALIGNPAGYLPEESGFDRIGLDLPRLQIVPLGPSWLRGWEATFFAALILFAAGFKAMRRVA